MSKANVYFSVVPSIVPANRRSSVSIIVLDAHCSFKPDTDYKLYCVPAGGVNLQTKYHPHQEVPHTIQGNVLQFEYDFEIEQEYVLVLQSLVDGNVHREYELRMYALEEDLFSRRPLKGDTHLHTLYSDGVESPAFVAARCRQIGLDFMAITDHGTYPPSLEAMDAMEALGTDLKAFPGEEVHPPDNMVHMVNFGGKQSLNALFGQPEYAQEVEKIKQKLAGTLPAEDLYTYASCIYCFDKIREYGGLGIFCHPYWFTGHQYDVPEYLTNLLMEQQPYDALEVIGGFHRHQVESNVLAVARYHEERTKGRKIPIVGATDSHGSYERDLFDWYYTIVLSPTDELGDIITSVKDLYSVAVEALPGESVRVHGPYRLTRYAYFLIREIFPHHDRLCNVEGTLMLAALAGESDALQQIKLTKGAVDRYYRKMWAE